jgi:putative ABC transport system substrate-binding protein
MMVDARRPARWLAGGLIALVAWLALAGPGWAADRPYHIFMILGRGETEVEQGFRDYFRDKGIDIKVTVRNIENDVRNLPPFIAEAKRLRPDLVYTWGTGATVGTVGTYDAVDPDKHITDIPVVFTLVTSPVGAKIVPSFESSGRNVTGASHVVPLESQVNALRVYRPFDTLAAIFNPLERNSVQQVEELRRMGTEQGFSVIERPVPLDAKGAPDPDALPGLVAEVAALHPDFLYMGPDTFVAGVHRDVVTAEANRLGLATFSATEGPLRQASALFGLVTRYYNLGRLTAYKAEQILVGGKDPKDIPVQTLTRFSYIVNMQVAKDLHLYPPMTVLRFAEILD